VEWGTQPSTSPVAGLRDSNFRGELTRCPLIVFSNVFILWVSMR
jgi:hypothetical protein